ncbi:zinc ribbon domain-containing protein [Halosimplex rubrum]|uniref:Zinc ribbon domain-containing protein n=1 Tax=Halosimplex rubrum TaxID=869889 RepID=A0A7D5T730_9EURY|nr:zinc ribbon domain-containing protein [Halosimplex rubrum]QLH78155.1 zinc ribbon domain-containing protein [Halosimplex rubrum]
MTAKKFRLDEASTVRENGYDWNVVECTECGEQVQQRHVEDDGHRQDVCPACDQEMTFDTSNEIEIPSVKSQSTIDWENNHGENGGDAPDAV